MNRRVFVGGITASLVGALTGCLSPTAIFGKETRTENQIYGVGAGTRLTVRNRNGSVTVEEHDGDDVEVDIEVRGPSRESLNSVSVTGTHTEDELRLETTYKNTLGQQKASVTLTIRLPEDVLVGRIRTVNGSIDVEVLKIEDDVEVRTTNGSIDAALAADLDANVSATTTNGSVELHDLSLSSVQSSRTDVSGSLGEDTHDLTLQTTNGSIDLRALSGA